MQTIDQIRHARFLELLNDSESGSVKAMAERIGVSAAQVSQIKNRSPHSKTGKPRNIGDEFARRIEEAYAKPVGWMDSHPRSVTGSGGITVGGMAHAEFSVPIFVCSGSTNA